MICIHGYGMGYPFVDLAAFPLQMLYDRLGFNVVLPVLPLHGPRRIGRISGERFLECDVLDTIHAESQAVWDLRSIMAWIRAQRATAIGVYGLSLGGYNAALLASLESDLSCVVAGIPAVDFLRLGCLHTRRQSIECAIRSGIDWSRMAETMRVISPLAMTPKVSRNRLFLFAGSCDRIVPPEQPRALWAHWDRPRMCWFRGGHFWYYWEPAVADLLRKAVRETMLVGPRSIDAAAA